MGTIQNFCQKRNTNANSGYKPMITFAVFCLLILWTSYSDRTLLRRSAWRDSNRWLDVLGLLMQGVVVPALQVVLVFSLLNTVTPSLKGRVSINPLWAFLLNFIVVDYLYYWNHRLLHTKAIWTWHAVHHTAGQMDVWVTSRNTLWSPFFILYMWINGFSIFILKDPAPYVLAASCTAALDLWRHSRFTPQSGSLVRKLLSLGFVTPHDHSWHHSSDRPNCNYGANLNWWDRLHGTYYSPEAVPARLGIELNMNFWRKLFYPMKREVQ